jgi:hypothetical protein
VKVSHQSSVTREKTRKKQRHNQIRQVNSKSMEVSDDLVKKIRVDSQIRQVNSKSMEVSNDSGGKNQTG